MDSLFILMVFGSIKQQEVNNNNVLLSNKLKEQLILNLWTAASYIFIQMITFYLDQLQITYS